MTLEEKYDAVPIWKRTLITIDEAAAYTGIGVNRLRNMTAEPDCNFVIWIGGRRMIKRRKFDKYIDDMCAL